METNYEITMGTAPVGRVQVLRQGLYYCFHCRCRLSGNVVYRLRVSCGDKRDNLGVLVPMGDGFGLDTRRPVKNIGEGTMSFCLVPKHDSPSGKFVPICPEEPFAYLERLKNAYLETREGKPGAVLPEDSQ